LSVSADDFADLFCDLSAPQVIFPPDLVRWMMRVFLFGVSMLISVLPLLWALRRMSFVLTAFHLSFLSCYCLLSLIMFFMYLNMLGLSDW
jgi:hypothetical protein